MRPFGFAVMRTRNLVAVIAATQALTLGSGAQQVNAYSANDVVASAAGNGTVGYSGDGGPAALAQLNAPRALAFDATGNMYVADVGSHTVRKVTAAGIITTVAGTGAAGYNGDGLPAVSAQLNSPYGLTTDAAGNLYIADSGNNRIRKVLPDGTIITIAGTGSAGCSNGTGDPTTATLSSPGGMTFDSAGNLLIADNANHVIRKIDVGGTISTFAGTCGVATYLPNGMAADGAGNVYFADATHARVYIVSAAGTITPFAGSGTQGYGGDGSTATAGNVQLNFPYSVAHDGAGDLFIGDSTNHVVRVVTPDGIIHTAAGNGTQGNSGDGGLAVNAAFNFTFGVAVNAAGQLVVADGSSNPVVRWVGAAAPLIVKLGGDLTHGPSIRSADGRIACPTTCGANYVAGMPVVLLPQFNYYVGLYQWAGGPCAGNAVRCSVTPRAPTPTTVTGYFSVPYIDTAISGIGAFGLAMSAGGELYIADVDACVVRKRTLSGTLVTVAGNGVCGYIGDDIPATSAELSNPVAVAVDNAGDIFIQDNGSRRVFKVTPDGVIHYIVALNAAKLGNAALALDPQGNLYLPGTETPSDAPILKVYPNGSASVFATLYGDAGLRLGLATNPAGGLGAVVIDAAQEKLILMSVSADGQVSALDAFAPFGPASVGFGSNGREYVTTESTVFVYVPPANNAGSSALAAQSASIGYSGDGGPVVFAKLNNTQGLAGAPDGRLYVADYGNHAVRVIYSDAIFTGDMDE